MWECAIARPWPSSSLLVWQDIEMNQSSNANFKCWAAPQGGCDQKLSREHTVSEGLFPDGVVHVSGFDWCKGETKSIGVSGLARKILCGKHNSDLSPADKEAIKAINLFQRLKPPKRGDPPLDPYVDGHRFERWLLKTAINVSYDSEHHIGVGMTNSQPGVPSAYLIDVAMGKLPFTHLMGAHFVLAEGETEHDPHEIIIIPLIKDDVIGGFYFELRSQPVFLNLLPGHAPETLRSVANMKLQDGLLDASLIYRPKFIASAAGGMPTSMVRFNW